MVFGNVSFKIPLSAKFLIAMLTSKKLSCVCGHVLSDGLFVLEILLLATHSAEKKLCLFSWELSNQGLAHFSPGENIY